MLRPWAYDTSELQASSEVADSEQDRTRSKEDKTRGRREGGISERWEEKGNN